MARLRWSSLVFLAGCTAAKAQFQILSAEEGLHTAAGQDADRVAVFEYQMATLYLDKAKEEAGYSQFRMADALARQSAEWSDRAIIFVQRHGRGQSGEELSNEAGAPANHPSTVQPDPAPKPIGDLDDEVEIKK
jgi:hypothetical protein